MTSTQPTYGPGFLQENTGDELIIYMSIFIGVMITSVLLRFWAKRLVRAKLRIEDWLIIPSLICMVAASAQVIASVSYGGAGYHIISLVFTHPEKIVRFAKSLIAFGSLYIVGMTLPKISMLIMFLRIFVAPWQRRACYSLIVFVIATAVADSIVNWNMCTPLAFLWDPTIPGGHCVEVQTFWRWGGLSNILTDVAMILLPIPAVLKLQLSWKDKIGVLLTLLAGGGGLVASILRFRTYYVVDGFGAGADPTYAVTSEAIFAVLECAVYIVCACLPSYRAFYMHIRKNQRTKKTPKHSTSSSRSWKSIWTRSSRSDESQIPHAVAHPNTMHSRSGSIDDLSEKRVGFDGYTLPPVYALGRPERSGITVQTEFAVSRQELGGDSI